MDDKFKEIINLMDILKRINHDLHVRKIYDIEYMLVNHSVSDVFHVMEDNSPTFHAVKDDCYSNGVTISKMLETYFIMVKEKYSTLILTKDREVDNYFYKTKEHIGNRGNYIQYPKSRIDMTLDEVKKTLLLMEEAILAFYKMYYNKILLAELTSGDALEFQIQEGNLLHLLGVTINQLRDNPDFIRLTGHKQMAAPEILEWLLRDMDGNNDLLCYHDDFLKKFKEKEYALMHDQFSPLTSTRLINFHKVRVKAQTFLKYGPLDKVAMVASLGKGKSLTKNAKSNVAVVSRAEAFKKYPWAYFGVLKDNNKSYVETLVIDDDVSKRDRFKGAKPAIIKDIVGITGSGNADLKRVFSEKEQFDLFLQAYEAFNSTMDFTDLKNYFLELFNKMQNDRSK